MKTSTLLALILLLTGSAILTQAQTNAPAKPRRNR